MENVPPTDMSGDNLPTLDELLHSKQGAKSSRKKRVLAPNTRTNGDREDEDLHALLTPPSSESQEEDMDASRMLFSPPPEEVLRQGRTVSTSFRLHSLCNA